ncbi:hypothetical protein AVEN_50483-1 [Araneus ventricosus]|uniref:Uncharacterized protein n=1 Tax=Araneus ventricosus TaxID=182803 RepID=A0A4Y2APN5_ARAVE|nr:hypothetical protein AVEN_50483-1 [Araneus ventricosus]
MVSATGACGGVKFLRALWSRNNLVSSRPVKTVKCQMFSRCSGEKVWRGDFWLRYHPRLQDYEFHPKNGLRVALKRDVNITKLELKTYV